MAGDDAIAVKFGKLSEISAELEALLRDLDERLERLYGRTEKVVLSWEGETRDAFVEALDKWDRSMRDMQGAQRGLHEMVVNGHRNYAAAHQAVLRGWGTG